MERRFFLRNTAMAMGGISVGLPRFSEKTESKHFSRIKFGICADLHHDIIYDAPERLSAFINEMQQTQPDFIIQLGDFCCPHDRNRQIMEIWNEFTGPKYHVIGNHDIDGGFKREQVVAFWKAKGKYYSFDQKGYHFVVLDTNENEYNPLKNPLSHYGSFVGDEQLQWLESDLNKTDLPVIVFGHHGLDNDMTGVENATKVRFMLERANSKSKFRKVQLVFSGHHHQDYVNVINDILYVQINSMSYKWLGQKYGHMPYTEEINLKHPLVKYTVPYKNPLWAVIDISANGHLKLTGKRSEFVGKSPVELGVPEYENIYPIVPFISDRDIRLVMK